MNTSKLPASKYPGPAYERSRSRVTVSTVQELREALAHYPDDLPVRAGFTETAQLVWYNVGRDDEGLELEENQDEPMDGDDESWE